MKCEKVLIISSVALSNSESNGRILSLLFNNQDKKSIFNYCIGGIPDQKGVNYLLNSDINNIKSLISFGFVKPHLFSCQQEVDVNNDSRKNKKKKAIHYFVRNILYFTNCYLTRFLKRLVLINGINKIFLFGTDAPYLYKLARQLSKKCDIPLEIYTCEDYPLKDYNYIENGAHNKNVFFRWLIKSLKKQASKAYQISSSCCFNSEPLLYDYKKAFVLNNPKVRYLPSALGRIEYRTKDIRHIVYGGNLYADRVNSLIDISDALLKINKDVVLDIYGRAKDEDVVGLSKKTNINYHGPVKYEDMIQIYKNADMLIHVDGFSEYSKKDFKHAFSTKISDCYILGVPFFVYSPIDIASTQYAFNMNQDFTCLKKEDLEVKLNKIINNHLKFEIDYQKIEKDFGGLVND